MAVSKIWKVTSRLDKVLDYAANPEKTSRGKYTPEQYEALADVLAYAKDEEKTEREFFVEGINCNPSTAREQFVTVKEQFDKTDGIQAYHGYLSFKEMDLSPELAQKIGMEFAEKVWGRRFQVVVTTHLNTQHLHCHFVINSVSFVDGKRLANEEKAWFKFRHIADELCKKYGLHYNPIPNRSKQSSYYYHLEKKEVPTRYNQAKAAIDEAISCSTSMVEFKYWLDTMGYKCQVSPYRKYWTVIPKGWQKPIRLINLGKEYSQENIMKRLLENQSKVILKPFQKAEYKPEINKREERPKVGGLYGLCLYYCYKLGALPKHKNLNPNKVHYLLRDDLLKLDEITAQVRFLEKHDIVTLEQLAVYKDSAESKMSSLIDERRQLRNKIRRVTTSEEEVVIGKERISEISAELKELRKEIKFYDAIAERSANMRANLQVVDSEEKLNRKLNTLCR